MKKLNLKYILLFCLAIFASSCKDSYDDDEAFSQGADFRIVNLATNNAVTPFRIYYNGNKLTESLLYNADSKYYRVKDGTANITVKTFDDTKETDVLSFSDNLTLNKNYTYFLVNPDAASSSIEYVKVMDDIAAPDFDMAKVRIGNFIQDPTAASNIDMKVNGTVVVSNIGYKQVTDFVTVKKSDKVEFVYTGTSTVVKPVTIALSSRNIYTFYLTGKKTGNPAIVLGNFSNTL